MTSQNIFQVQKEGDLDEILNKHNDKLTVIMFSSSTCGPCLNFKPLFLSVSRENPDCFFVYLDVLSFEQSDYKYLKNVKSTPKFSYYFNKHNMADVHGADKKVFLETMFFLKNKIKERNYEIQKDTINRQQVQQQQMLRQQQQQLAEQHDHLAHQQQLSQQDPQKLFNDKVEMLKKLYTLTQQGVVLSQNYGIDSDLHQMIQEYVRHTQSSQVPQVQIPIQSQNQTQNQSQNQSQTQTQTQTQNQVESQETHQLTSDALTQEVPIQTQTPSEQSNVSNMSNEQLLHLKKQEQLKKIKELNNVSRIMQMQQMFKLQKLQQIQKKKEEEADRQQQDNNNEESE